MRSGWQPWSIRRAAVFRNRSSRAARPSSRATRRRRRKGRAGIWLTCHCRLRTGSFGSARPSDLDRAKTELKPKLAETAPAAAAIATPEGTQLAPAVLAPEPRPPADLKSSADPPAAGEPLPAERCGNRWRDRREEDSRSDRGSGPRRTEEPSRAERFWRSGPIVACDPIDPSSRVDRSGDAANDDERRDRREAASRSDEPRRSACREGLGREGRARDFNLVAWSSG